MYLVLDFENTVTDIGDKKFDPRPFQPNNRLVSAGWQLRNPDTGSCVEDAYEFFYHKALDADPVDAYNKLQAALNKTTLLIAQNAKYELLWLWECGFEYNGPAYCTMIGEYVLLRGLKYSVSLEESAKRRNVSEKKGDLTEDYLAKGIGFESMPPHIVEEYGRQDVQTCWELYEAQQRLYSEPRNQPLRPTLDLMNEFQVALAAIEQNGICIDLAALRQARKDLEDERAELELKMREICWKVMGDTPINFASGEQLSQLIYSRKVLDKKAWKKAFNLGTNDRGKPLPRPKMSKSQFSGIVRANTEKLRKTKAHRCKDCWGTGYYYRTKKDGDLYAKPSKCSSCNATGLIYINQNQYAGFKLSPDGVHDVAEGGFATNKDTLEKLKVQADAKGYTLASEFLDSAIRLNAIEHYLSSFIRGIERSCIPCGDDRAILHPKFNQCVTKTGRLSSSDPNFQNLPKGNVFTLRRVIISRWPDGYIAEDDYEQLEFRIAGHLAKDDKIKEDVIKGVDVHTRTAETLTEAGEETDRQGAKAHTFAPIYGATNGTKAQKEYYRRMLEEFAPGLSKWHQELQEEAIRYGRVRLPTGREYAFPDAKRMPWGGSSNATQIKNFPVQGLATADIVPLAVLLVHYRIKREGLKSRVILTVHDSIVVDVHNSEAEYIPTLVTEEMLAVQDVYEQRYGEPMFIPLGTEAKMGKNWLEMSKMKKVDMAA